MCSNKIINGERKGWYFSLTLYANRSRRSRLPYKEKDMSVFTWRHGGHIGVPKQWNGGHDAVPNQSCGSWTLFLCKCFLLFQYFCIDVGHISENSPLFGVFSIFYIRDTIQTTLQLYSGPSPRLHHLWKIPWIFIIGDFTSDREDKEDVLARWC